MSATQTKDGNQHHWSIASDAPHDKVDAWWARTDKKFRGRTLRAESFVLRQENPALNKADLIVLSLGQVYDLIDTLNKAVLET